MSASIVSLQHVTKRFPDTVAVDSVTLDVGSGEFLTLLGPSGCGKTTLLRLIGGFESPDKGKILLGGADVTALPPHRRDVRTVFQHYALFPHLSVEKNVAFGLERLGRPKEEIRRRVADALALVHLSELGERMPSQLSGGQQQRVAIARAVVLEPRVLLLDEPLGALDRKLRATMQVELKELQRRLGVSFIFVTHDQEEALVMSDRVAVMQDGRVEQLATPREIYERPLTEFVASFVGVTNFISGRVCESSNGTSVVEAAGGRFQIPAPLSSGAPVRLAVRPEKVRFVGGDTAAVSGVIETSLYLGDSTEWQVRLDDGSRWTVRRQNDGSDHLLEAGARVGLAWDPVHGVPLTG